MQRSQKYDWFKGSKNEKDKKKDIKQAAKTTWKFTKIFLIFFVLFMSLWGCVQGFTLKQSSFVGRGTEFYLNEEEIPPHIQEWKENHTGDPAKDIYSLSATDANIWLNREDKLSNRKDIDAVHTELKTQGVNSLAEAYKGVNEANRIINKDGKSINDHAILFDGTKPVVGSTESKLSAASKAELQTLRDNYTTADANGKGVFELKIVPAAPATGTSPATPEYTSTNIKILTDWDATNNKYNSSTLNFADKDRTKLTADQKAIADQRDWFRLKTLDAINKATYMAPASGNTFVSTNRNWIVDALTLKNNYEPKSEAEVANIKEAQTNALKVLAYLGFESDGFDLHQSDWDYMPGMNGETYVPILTWGQAWERGVGPFYGLAVFPISKFTIAVAESFPLMSGWETLFAMIVVIFILRFLGFLVTFRSTLQQTKMQELGLKKAAIDAKYAPYKGNKQMQARQRQEVAEMYKKEGVSPMGAFTSVLIVMPLFLAIWRVIGSTPHIKSTVWYGINFSETSWRKLFAGEVIYLPLMALALGFSIGSQMFPKLLTRKRDKQRGNAHLKQAMKKNDKTQIIIMIITAGMSLIFTAGLQVYWIVVSVWTIIQSLLTHYILKWNHKRVRQRAKA